MTLEEITVSLDTTGTGLISIPLQDIIFIQYVPKNKGVLIHSLDNEGFLPGAFEFWLTALVSAGLANLKKVDRSFAANLSKIELLDQKLKVAYFEQRARRDKGCTVAVANFESLIASLRQLNQQFRFI